MISAIGNLSLCGAVLIAATAVLASVISVRFGSARALRVVRWSMGLIAVMMTISAGALLTAILTNDFGFSYVVGYSERALPIGYKIAAFWAGQEGSLLLWGWLLAMLCFVAAIGLRREKGADHAIALATMAVVCGFFAVLLLFAANPFELVEGAVALDGRGLNPMLQDPGMIAHPPLLFIGYAGFTIPFAVMIGVLVSGRTDNRWLASIRRWLVMSWTFLGAGIVLGAWWAYVELGWGGYWAWDPVENASLLPWLTATALMHSIMVQQHRGMFKIWNVSLIAMTFILCIFGTYLTRSGVIESVHAFGGSLLGTFFLVFLVLCTAISVGLIAWRAKALKPEHEMEGLISREGAFLLGNVLMTVMMLITLIGTIFPLFSGLFMTEPVTVKPVFYNRIVAPMAILIVGLMAFGPVLAFGKSAALKIGRRLIVPGIAAFVVTVIVAVLGTTNVWALLCVAVATLGTFAVIVDFIRSVSARHRSTGENWLTAALLLIDKDHRRYGGQLAHLGIMLLVVGVAASSLFSIEQTESLAPGQTVGVGEFQLKFVSLDEVREVNYTAVQATVILTARNGDAITLYPQRRYYDTWKDDPNSEVAIRSTWREDVYVSLAGWKDGGAITTIQVKINPLVLWIWIGGIVIAVGGLFCILPRLLPKAQHVPAVEPVTKRAIHSAAKTMETAT